MFLNNLPNQEKFRVPKYQLAKASTSIGANYEESQAAESKKDFIHKIGIVLKETRESNYWLRVIEAVSLNNKNIDKITLKQLIKESVEFKKIFTTIKINSQKNDD